MAKRRVLKKDGNSVISTVTWKSIMRSKAFRIGFEEVMNNKPFQYDAFETADAWNYERGRQFAALGYNKKYKEGNKVLDEAVHSFQECYRMKLIR